MPKAITVLNGQPVITDERFAAFILSLNEESDRAFVIIVSIIVEEKLKAAVQAFLVEGKERQVFMDRNIKSFDATARAAYCLGIISKREFQIVSWIRRLRNGYAHNFLTGDPSASLEAQRGSVFSALSSFLPGYHIDTSAHRPSRKAFKELALHIVWALWERPEEIAHADYIAEERDE